MRRYSWSLSLLQHRQIEEEIKRKKAELRERIGHSDEDSEEVRGGT